MSKPWRVQVREDHFVVLGANGDEMLTSVKEYASPASAKRAAERFVSAMLDDFEVESEQDGEMVRETARRSSSSAQEAAPSAAKSGGKISPPVAGKTLHASSPYAQ